MEKKYELTDITKEYDGHILYRICALRDFSNIHNGDLGGWIEKEESLSQEGNCWVYDDAIIYGNAVISMNAIVFGHAEVYGNAKVFDNASVGLAASICGDAKVFGNSIVSYHSSVFGNAMISDNVRVYDDAIICGTACITGYSYIGESAYINDSDGVLTIGNIGSRNDTTTFYLTESDDIMVCCGCFNDTIQKFNDAVHETHKDNPKHLIEYLTAIELAKVALIK